MLKSNKKSIGSANIEVNYKETTQEQIYSLDTTGIIIIKKFINESAITYMNSLIDDHLANRQPIPSKFAFFTLDPIFMDLLSHPWIMSACTHTVGNHFRFDHVVGIEQPGMIKSAKTGEWVDQGYSYGNIHGGLHSSQGSCFFHSYANKIWAGHMTFGLSLTGQNKDTGGFCYIPGSHKQVFADNGADLFKKKLNANYSSSCIIIPDMDSGDAVFFP